MTEHPALDLAYVLAEHSSDVHVFEVDATGHLISPPRATVATTEGVVDNWSSDVHVSFDATRLFAVNRTNEEVAELAIDEDGDLTYLGSQPLMGVVRAFAIDPEGPHLYFGDADGHHQHFQLDGTTGRLVAGYAASDLGNIQAAHLVYLPTE